MRDKARQKKYRKLCIFYSPVITTPKNGLSIQYALKLKSIPYHPTHRAIFQPKYTIKFANKPTAIPTFGLRVKSILDDIPLIELSDIAEYQKPENPV